MILASGNRRLTPTSLFLTNLTPHPLSYTVFNPVQGNLICAVPGGEPLASGGCDSVTNMQWLPKTIKTCTDDDCKDRWERKGIYQWQN